MGMGAANTAALDVMRTTFAKFLGGYVLHLTAMKIETLVTGVSLPMLWKCSFGMTNRSNDDG